MLFDVERSTVAGRPALTVRGELDVATTNLAGRTLADLVLGHDTELTRLPWVGHESPSWEPEPLRFLGANAGMLAMSVADAEERLTGRASLVARVMGPLVGH